MQQPTVLSRREAFEQGVTRYYTGVPCRQGHIAPRYVSTGACLECLSPFKQRKHPHRKDLKPYVCPRLWVPTTATPEQYAALEVYLGQCIDAFFKAQDAAGG